MNLLHLLVYILFIAVLFVFYRSFREPQIMRIIRIDTIAFIDEPLNAAEQNVHDTNVREKLWEKYYLIHDSVADAIKNYGEETLYNVAKEMPQYVMASENEKKQLAALINTIYTNPIPIVDTRNKNHSEKEIFAYCYYKFRKMGLDRAVMKTQYLDCFENGEPACLVGRISRYIGMFEGLTDEPIGQSEETKPIIFQRALHEAKKMLDEALGSNPELKQIYDATDANIDDEKKLYDFLQIVRGRVLNRLRAEYPKLTDTEVNNILLGIN